MSKPLDEMLAEIAEVHRLCTERLEGKFNPELANIVISQVRDAVVEATKVAASLDREGRQKLGEAMVELKAAFREICKAAKAAS